MSWLAALEEASIIHKPVAGLKIIQVIIDHVDCRGILDDQQRYQLLPSVGDE
jgi:hypothetical protein